MRASAAASRAGARLRRRRLLAVLGVGLAVAVGLVLLARGVRERRALRDAHPAWQGTLAVSGLSGPLTILRDPRGIPHVRAERRSDAFFGLGFVHAQDRLAQMEWLRAVARGRAAASVGPEGLALDRLSRTLGFAEIAARELERLDSATRRTLDAYVAGVNARVEGIASGRVAPPRPLAQLGVALEPWEAVDVLAVAKLYAFGLDSSLEASLVLWDLIEHLGGFEARPFFPSDAASSLVPFPGRGPVEARPGRFPLLRAAIGLHGATVGSSAWVVAGLHSARGAPLLAADTHLEPTVPPLLHQAHLSAPDLEVAGAAVPGIPVFWSGHNRRVAWASTHARAVVVDLYKETLDESDPSRYRVESRWRAIEEREERIEVRGRPPHTLRVRATRHGPLVHELVEPARPPLALAWAGAEPGNGIASFLKAFAARNAREFRAALADHHDPVLAVVFADAAGAGGLQVAGWVPRRAMPTSLVPVPGRAHWYDWRGRVPFAELPAVELDAEVGWLIAADNPLGSAGESDSIEWLWRTGERAARIDTLLRDATRRGLLDLRTLTRLQRDVHDGETLLRVRLALELAGPLEDLPREARELARLLGSWDGNTGAKSVGATAYHVFVVHLLRELLADPLGADLFERYLALPAVSPETLIGQLLTLAFEAGAPDTRLANPERVRRAVRTSLREAGLELIVKLGTHRAKWNWGRLHRLRFRPFGWSEAAWLSSFGPRARTEQGFPYGGDRATVAVGDYDFADPFDVRVVSAWRVAIDLGDPDVSLSALAPGPVELPAHPHQDSELDAWRAGKARLLASQGLLVEEIATHRLRLEPAP